MAEDQGKEEAKEKLRFFKNGNGKAEEGDTPTADEAAQAVATEEPNKNAASDTGSSGARATEDKAEAQAGARKAPGGESDDAGGDAKPSAGGDEGKSRRRRRGRKVKQESSAPSKTSLMPYLIPSLTLGFRTLVILAIIVADAFAAYVLTTKVIAPKIIETKVVDLQAEMGQLPPEGGAEKPPVKEKPSDGAVGNMLQIKDIVVNPSGTNGTRYLCTTVAFEITDPLLVEEATAREAQVRDLLIEILGRRTVQELSSLEMRDYIRGEIHSSVNELLTKGEVDGVYFSNFVLQ